MYCRRTILTWVFLALSLFMSGTAAAKPLTIYLALWRGCELACQGFKNAIVKSGTQAVFIERDAANDKSRLAGFVEEVRSLRPDLVLTWGTTVTLAMAGKLQNAGDPRFIADIPIVYMIVADAVGTGIIESFEKTGRNNVTGTHNRVPEAININAIRTYLPRFQKLGMLYNVAEPNSVAKVEEVRALAGPLGFELEALPFDLDASGRPDPTTIPEKMQALRDKAVDFIYVGSSSFIEKNGAQFTSAALQAGLPVLSPYERLVSEADALLSVSARYDAVGKLAARQALRILVDGASPGQLPVLAVTKFAFVVNMDSARRLKLFPPLELLQIAETVH